MKDLTTGKEMTVIASFAWPMILGNIFQNLHSVVDSIIVGNILGKEALGAVGASFPFIYILISIVIGIGSGASVVISQYFGAKREVELKRAIDTVMIFLLTASVLVSIIGIPIVETVYHLMRFPDDIFDMAVDYTSVYLIGMVFFFGFNGISSTLRGVGDSKTPLRFMVGATLINIVLDYTFIAVFKWGVASVAWATIIAQGLAFFSAVIYLNRKDKIIKFGFRKYVFDLFIFKESVRIGLPTALQQSFVAIGITFMMGVVNGFGTDVVAAYSAALKVDAFAKMPSMNFASALSTFVGQNLGADKIDRVKKGLNATLVISGVYSLIVTLFALLFGRAIMFAFVPDLAVVEIGYQYLVIVGSSFLFFSVMFTYIGLFRGAGASMFPMIVSLVTLWCIRIPIAIYLSKVMGPAGIWWSFPISWFIGSVASYFYYRSDRWKGKMAKVRS